MPNNIFYFLKNINTINVYKQWFYRKNPDIILIPEYPAFKTPNHLCFQDTAEYWYQKDYQNETGNCQIPIFTNHSVSSIRVCIIKASKVWESDKWRDPSPVLPQMQKRGMTFWFPFHFYENAKSAETFPFLQGYGLNYSVCLCSQETLTYFFLLLAHIDSCHS